MCSGDKSGLILSKIAAIAMNLLWVYSFIYIFGIHSIPQVIQTVVLGNFVGFFGPVLGGLFGNQVLRRMLSRPPYKGKKSKNEHLMTLIQLTAFTIPLCASISIGSYCLAGGMQIVQRLNLVVKINNFMFWTLFLFTARAYLESNKNAKDESIDIEFN